MEIVKPVKQTFMAEFDRFEPASRDHTAIIAFKECKRLFFYKIVLGFTDRITPSYFQFGKGYHTFREVLETSHRNGASNTLAFQKALEATLKQFAGSDPPAGSKWEFLTTSRLIVSAEKAFKVWKKEKQQNKIKVIAVEQPFEILLADGKTRRGGKADQFVRWNGRLYGRDWKTSSKSPGWYDRTLDPNDQFTGYTLGLSKLSGEMVQGLMIEVLFNTKTKGPDIKTYLATRSPWQLEQWEREQVVVEKMINICREDDVWPMEEKSCAFCAFRSVCKKGTESAQMNQLRSEFRQRPWNYKDIEGMEYYDGTTKKFTSGVTTTAEDKVE